MNYSFTLGNQAYLVQNPWSVDTNVSWHTTARKHMQQMFLLFRCYHKKSTSVVWHHRDTSQTKTRKVGQNVWASYEFPDLEYAESIPKKHSNEKRFSRMAEEVWDVGRCATSDKHQHFTGWHEHRAVDSRGILGYALWNMIMNGWKSDKLSPN